MTKPLHINQAIIGIAHGDAMSNYVLEIRKTLLQKGYKSNIYVIDNSQNCFSLLKKSNIANLKKSDWVLFHYGQGSSIANTLIEENIKTCLIYHNITPASYFTQHSYWHQILTTGREQLAALAKFCPLSASISQYNIDELKQYGFKNPHYLPLIIDQPTPHSIDEVLYAQLTADDYKNILFVGRFSPHKRQDQLIKVFARYVTQNPKTRLILVGSIHYNDPYVQNLLGLRATYGLQDKIIIPGHMDDRTLQTYFRSAHLFLSMSEHEGFCIPLIEAMWYDIPAIAYNSSAIPETLANTGILFDDLNNIPEICALIDVVLHDTDIQQNLLKAQIKRRQDFTQENFIPHLDRLLAHME